MKSNFFKSFLALAAMSFGLFSCDEPVPPVVEDPTATFEVKVNSVSQTTAEIGIEATLIDEIAYVVEEQQSDDLLPAVVFAIGKDVDPAATTVTLKDLDANKTYWVYFAAKTQGDFFEDKVFELEVSTMDYTFDKMLTLVDTELMGFKVRVTVPDEVSNESEKFTVRYNFGSLLDVLLA